MALTCRADRTVWPLAFSYGPRFLNDMPLRFVPNQSVGNVKVCASGPFHVRRHAAFTR